MTESTIHELKLECVASNWRDHYHNLRSHAIIVLPSGCTAENIIDVFPVENGSECEVKLSLPEDLFSAYRILSHRRFNRYLGSTHPKWISLQGALDEAKGKMDRFICRARIKLPGSGYSLTDPDICGHSNVVVVEDASEAANEAEESSKTTVFLIVDLMVKKEHGFQQPTRITSFEDDFEAD
jgi:hypothetical protein